jgi:hypothetical protein
MNEQIIVLGQVAHFAEDACSDDPLFAEVPSVTFCFELSFDGLQTTVEVVDLGVEGLISIDLCNEVPLIQIVNSCSEDGVVGLGTPQHMSEPRG